MIVPFEIPDKLWADFCLHLEHACNCGCGGDGEEHMLTQIRQHMLDCRARKIAIKRHRRLRREGKSEEYTVINISDFLEYLKGGTSQLLPSMFSREEQEDIQEVFRDYGLTK